MIYTNTNSEHLQLSLVFLYELLPKVTYNPFKSLIPNIKNCVTCAYNGQVQVNDKDYWGEKKHIGLHIATKSSGLARANLKHI